MGNSALCQQSALYRVERVGSTRGEIAQLISLCYTSHGDGTCENIVESRILCEGVEEATIILKLEGELIRVAATCALFFSIEAETRHLVSLLGSEHSH